jgi:uncharacterized membrane protein AbrB (regulator of aidB expression)
MGLYIAIIASALISMLLIKLFGIKSMELVFPVGTLLGCLILVALVHIFNIDIAYTHQ